MSESMDVSNQEESIARIQKKDIYYSVMVAVMAVSPQQRVRIMARQNGMSIRRKSSDTVI